MSADTFLIVVRLLSALILFLFVAGIMWFLYQDLRQAQHQLDVAEKPLAYLQVLYSEAEAWPVGARVPLLAVTGIGRAPNNTVVINDDYTSSEHALLAVRNQRWWLEDLGSRNGTLLNGQQVTDAAVVSAGDVITIGRTQFKMEV